MHNLKIEIETDTCKNNHIVCLWPVVGERQELPVRHCKSQQVLTAATIEGTRAAETVIVVAVVSGLRFFNNRLRVTTEAGGTCKMRIKSGARQ